MAVKAAHHSYVQLVLMSCVNSFGFPLPSHVMPNPILVIVKNPMQMAILAALQFHTYGHFGCLILCVSA